MTWAGYKPGNRGYEGYTCIEPWKANSLKELQEHIKEYLEQLINILNSKTEECLHCNGTGITNTQVGTNKRTS